MDIPTLAYVYEGFDAGYGAYVGFHIVRKTHTHPIMLSFIALLLELKNTHAKEESKKSDAFLRARVSKHYEGLRTETFVLLRKPMVTV